MSKKKKKKKKFYKTHIKSKLGNVERNFFFVKSMNSLRTKLLALNRKETLKQVPMYVCGKIGPFSICRLNVL